MFETSSAIFKRRQRLTVTPETNNYVAHDDDEDNDTHHIDKRTQHISIEYDGISEKNPSFIFIKPFLKMFYGEKFFSIKQKTGHATTNFGEIIILESLS